MKNKFIMKIMNNKGINKIKVVCLKHIQIRINKTIWLGRKQKYNKRDFMNI